MPKGSPGATYVDPKFSFLQSFGITSIHFMRGAGLGPNYDGNCFVAAHNSLREICGTQR